MKTLKTLLFAALATIGFSFAAQAETYGPNLIKNGTFALKSGDTTTKTGAYSAKADLSDPFTDANPFYKSLEENTWYGYCANNTQTASSSGDRMVGFGNTTSTSDGSRAATIGKAGVLCAEFTVPVGAAGKYELKYSGKYYNSSNKGAVTVYVTQTSNIANRMIWPGGAEGSSLTDTTTKKKQFGENVAVACPGKGLADWRDGDLLSNG